MRETIGHKPIDRQFILNSGGDNGFSLHVTRPDGEKFEGCGYLEFYCADRTVVTYTSEADEDERVTFFIDEASTDAIVAKKPRSYAIFIEIAGIDYKYKTHAGGVHIG